MRLAAQNHFAICIASLLMLTSCGIQAGNPPLDVITPFWMYWAVRTADLNGDGRIDIAVSMSCVSGQTTDPASAAVYLQDPLNPGSFQTPITYSIGNNDPVAIALGDLNRDGRVDIATANSPRSGHGNSSFSVLLQDPANPGSFLPARNYSAGTYLNSIAMGDLNEDGNPDIALGDMSGVILALQDAAVPANFLSPRTLPLATAALGVAIDDLDGDHFNDIAVSMLNGMAVMLQTPVNPGTFSSPTVYPAGLQPFSLVIADLNADGRPDVAVANLGSSNNGSTASASVLLQNPNVRGSFLPAIDYKTGNGSMSIAAVDLNADTLPDITVGNANACVSILFQNRSAPGSFLPAVNYSGRTQVLSVAAADLNTDGKADLVLADSRLLVLLQDAVTPGKFSEPIVLAEPRQ
jgi:VCBS repeat protein